MDDYYPFGMLEPGRQYTATGGTGYRYGFNGKEQDNDIDGSSVVYDYGFRIYDSRIGRFLSVDPLMPKYPELSSYQFASNSPIANIDIDGKEAGWSLRTPNLYLQNFVLKSSLPRNQLSNDPATSAPAPVIAPIRQNHSEALPAAAQQAAQRAQFNTAHPKPAQEFVAPPPPTFIDAADFSTEAGEQRKQEIERAQRIGNAMQDDVGGLGIAASFSAVGSAPVNHGFGIYDGIRDGNGWQIAGNSILLALDLYPVAKGFSPPALLEGFEQGGTKLVSSEMLNRFPGSPTIGSPAGTFIAPTTEVNSMLSQGLSRSQIAEKLGITDPAFLKGDLIRVDLSANSLRWLKLRAPACTESGANSLFVPGGKTVGGVTEGIVNGIPANGGMKGVTQNVIPNL